MTHFGDRSAILLRGTTRCVLASLLFALTTAAAQNCPSPTLWSFDDRQVAVREYNSWLELDRIARMPGPERAGQVPHVYHDIFADLHKRWYALDNWMIFPAPMNAYRKSKPPEHRENEQSFPGYPNMSAQGIAIGLFIAYPQQSQPLILQDLRSTDLEAVSRGIYVARDVAESAFPDLFDDLKRISFSDGSCADEALVGLLNYSLSTPYRMPERNWTPSRRALDLVPVIIPRFQKEPDRYARALRELLRFAPAPNALVADLDSRDPNLRRNALVALGENNYLIPARYILAMARNGDTRTRESSIGLGFDKRRSDFSELQPILAKLMYDPDFEVRLKATKNFGSLREPVCASPLLSLLKETYRTGNGEFFTLAGLADYVAHRKFGFDSGTERVPMQNERNEAALKQYEKWVRSTEH